MVEVEITEPGFADFREDASREIRPQSLIGEYYVDCQPGARAAACAGGTVPVEQTSSTIPTDVVSTSCAALRRALPADPDRARHRARRRPDDLQEVLRRAHPGLRETSRTLRILGDQNQVIKDFITDSDTVITRARAQQAGRGAGRGRATPPTITATRQDEPARACAASRPSWTSCARRWSASATWPTSRRRCSPTSSAPRLT